LRHVHTTRIVLLIGALAVAASLLFALLRG
jgi:hypothetical protein